MKRLLAIMFSILFLTGIARAEMNFGFSFMTGQLSTDGTESEKSGLVGPETNSKSIEESFYGASIFAEYVASNGIAYGIDYVPLDLKLGNGTRTDTTSNSNESTSDSGTYKAEAHVTQLITAYVNYPFFGGNYYGLLGGSMATVTTDETLPNSTYGSDDITGLQVGLGYKTSNMKLELSYTDFETIGVSSTSGSSSVEADADAVTLKLALMF